MNGDLQLDVTVSPDNETVWLTANQMALLFDRDEKTIRKHINNTFKDPEVEKENNTQKMRVVGVKQPVPKWNKFKWKVVAKYATTTKYDMGIYKKKIGVHMNNKIIKFVNGDLQLDVGISPEQNTVWLTVEQICTLFNKNKSTISRHIKNIFNERELDKNSTVAKNATQLKRFDPRTGKK